MSTPFASKRLVIAAILFSFIAVGCSANAQKSAQPTAEETAEAAANENAAKLLVGNWKMQLGNLTELEGLSEEERKELTRVAEEMTFVMSFTDDGKVKSSMDDQITNYTVKGNQVIVNGDAMIFTVSETELTLKGPEQVLKFTRTDKDLEKFANNAFASSARQAKQSEGKNYAGSLNRAQQAYFLEKSTFANSLDELGVGIQAETDLYEYSTRGTAEMSFNHAIAKHNDLRSLVGGVFVVDQGGEQVSTTLLCVADTPGSQKLDEPSFNGTEATCPSGSSSIR